MGLYFSTKLCILMMGILALKEANGLKCYKCEKCGPFGQGKEVCEANHVGCGKTIDTSRNIYKSCVGAGYGTMGKCMIYGNKRKTKKCLCDKDMCNDGFLMNPSGLPDEIATIRPSPSSTSTDYPPNFPSIFFITLLGLMTLLID